MPVDIQTIVTETVPGISGFLIPVDETYLLTVINITNIIFSAILPITILSSIFIIYKRNIFEILGILFFGLIPRERKFWGIVRDITSFVPIPFSQIRLFKHGDNDSKTLIAQNVADLDGRYRILFEDKDGNFFLEVKASGFKTYYKEISFINTLVNSDLIIDDILMERNDNEKVNFNSRISYLRPRINSLLIKLIFALNLLNIPLAIFVTLNNPIVINWVFIISAGITTVWNIKVIRDRFNPHPGRILDSEGKPLHNVIVELFSNHQKVSTVTPSHNGIIKFDSVPGTYLIRVATSDKLTNFIAVRLNASGYMQKDVKADLQSSEGTTLINPFS